MLLCCRATGAKIGVTLEMKGVIKEKETRNMIVVVSL